MSEELSDTSTDIDVLNLDAEYKPFPAFSEWKSLRVDTVRWERYSQKLQDTGAVPADGLERALEIVRRSAAVESGAIEGLYQTDRGFTIAIATQAAMWETILNNKGQKARSLIESQLLAYEKILDLVTESWPINEVAIRGLQSAVCGGQKDYDAVTEIGQQKLPLPKGVYKHLPNHVRTREGMWHAHAPVDLTPTEMYRLCEETRIETFQSAHPLLQATYIHYGLVVIHPFADGNGRTARALASVFTYRSSKVPVLIFSDQKGAYLDSLAEADKGDYQIFVDFMLERVLDAMQMAYDCLLLAQVQSAQQLISTIDALYVTRGGFSHDEVDAAGMHLLQALNDELVSRYNAEFISSKVKFDCHIHQSGLGEDPPQNYRVPIKSKIVILNVSTKPPAGANIHITIGVFVPKDCGKLDDLVILCKETKDTFEARITSVIPALDASLRVRIQAWADKILSGTLTRLSEAARKALMR